MFKAIKPALLVSIGECRQNTENEGKLCPFPKFDTCVKDECEIYVNGKCSLLSKRAGKK